MKNSNRILSLVLALALMLGLFAPILPRASAANVLLSDAENRITIPAKSSLEYSFTVTAEGCYVLSVEPDIDTWQSYEESTNYIHHVKSYILDSEGNNCCTEGIWNNVDRQYWLMLKPGTYKFETKNESGTPSTIVCSLAAVDSLKAKKMGELPLGEPVNPVIPAGGMVSYDIQIPDAYTYSLWSSQPFLWDSKTPAGIEVELYDEYGNCVYITDTNLDGRGSYWSEDFYRLKSGKYRVLVENLCSKDYTPTVLIDYAQEPTGVKIKPEYTTVFLDDEELYFSAILEPEDSITDYTWSIRDESVASIVGYSADWTGCRIEAVGIGSTELTVTLHNGLTASRTITVKETKPMNMGVNELTLTSGEREKYALEISESGYYCFSYPHQQWVDPQMQYPRYDIAIENKESVSETENGIEYVTFYLEAGTHNVYVTNIGFRDEQPGEIMSSPITVSKAPEVTGVSFAEDTYTIYTQQIVERIYVTFESVGSFEEFTVTIADENVAYVDLVESNCCYVVPKNTGTTTLTVITKSGKTATCSIRVVEFQELEIISQPVSVTAPEGTTAKFTVEAVGSDISYQWQWSASLTGTWANAGVAGNKTATLTVPATAGRNGLYYRCKIIDGSGEVHYSDAALLTVKSAHAITFQPTSQTVNVGENAIFAVNANGENLTYQWQYRTKPTGIWMNALAAGNKTATLTVPGTVDRSGFQYRCKITSGDVTIYSNVVKLTVNNSITVTQQPTNQTVAVGKNAIFAVKATGTNLTYQWEWKSATGTWANAGATGNKTATMSVGGTAARNGLYYRCRIADGNGGVTYSNAVLLTVTTPTGPTITQQPTNQTVAVGKNAIFIVKATGTNLTYQWEWKSATGTWANAGATGNKTATMSVGGTAARNGLYYRCRITDGNGGVTYSNAVLLTVTTQSAPTIATQPTNQTVAIGENAIFAVKAIGANLTYQWEWRAGANGKWANASASGNKTATLTVPGIAARNNFQYRCKITDANGNVVYSTIVILTVN